jgi:hypothetical protein
VITFNPANPSAPTATTLPTPVFGVWCQSSSLCLASTQTSHGNSALLGSYNPRGEAPKWTLSSLGGVNAVSCLGPAVCLAADDEGNIAAGATTRSLKATLRTQALSPRRLPRTRALVRAGGYRVSFATPIAATLDITWATPGPAATALTLATAQQRYPAPAAKPVRIRLTAAGRRLLGQARRRVRVVATATLTASTGSVTARQTLGLPPPAPARKRRH